MPQGLNFRNFQDNRALQYAIPANCVLIGALSLLLPVGPLSAAMMLDAFLLAMAAIGITGRAAVLIVPNIAIKILLLLMMLFVGCVSIDTFHANYIRESAGIVDEGPVQVVPQSPVSLWRTIVHTYPSLPLWIIAFVLLIVVEIRLFFCAWYRIAFGNSYGEAKEVERHPPSYAYCISHTSTSTCNADELPSYEEAIRRSSIQKPGCSKTTPTTTVLPRSVLMPSTSTCKTATVCPSSSQKRPQEKSQHTLRHSHSTPPMDVCRTMATLTLPEVIRPYRPQTQRMISIQIEQPNNASQ
ncbi:hypothetical protein Q1695_013186 [Nippostrongylus brasiliensis]|nr:hypothetical protein Q1695_013186 [Nippostrongylus brasiliensis]